MAPTASTERKTLLVSLVATVVGVVLLRVYMHRFEQEASGGPRTQVVVLTQDAEIGEALDRSLLGTRELPRAYLESRHVPASDIDEIVGARLGVAARAHEALLWTDLVNMRRSDRQLSTLVPEGMRAISVDLRAGNFDDLLRPGDRVDVLLSREGAAGVQALTEPLLENLLVLAVGDDTGAAGTPRKRSRGGRVTLSVTPRQGQRLTQAEHEGALRLVLRNPDDVVLSDAAAERRDVISSRAEGLDDSTENAHAP